MTASAPTVAADRLGGAANFILSQIGWFACVLGAARGLGHAGAALAAVIVLIHLHTVRAPRREARLVGWAVVIGLAVDSVLLHAGWIRYADPRPFLSAPPLWLLALWALFATTLNKSLRWLHRSPLVAAGFGAVGGPLAYLAAARLGAVSMPAQATALAALAVAWAIVTPLLLAIARRHDGVSPSPPGAGVAP